MNKSILLTLFVLILLPAQLLAASYQGRVVGISDGDTLTLLTASKTQVKVRLAEIDTPESAQPYGTRSRQELSGLVFGKDILVNSQGTDRYGRVIGRIFVDGKDVNAEMVKRGAAWVYRAYSKDKSLLVLEAEAKSAKRGLWGLPEAQRQAPWEWRQDKRAGSGAKSPASRTSQSERSSISLKCAGKTLCGQMTSCSEATFYLKKCGISRLDGDHDGVPCEAICR